MIIGEKGRKSLIVDPLKRRKNPMATKNYKERNEEKRKKKKYERKKTLYDYLKIITRIEV